MIIAFIGGVGAGKTIAGFLFEEAVTIHTNFFHGVNVDDREILPPGEEGTLGNWIKKEMENLKLFTRFLETESVKHFQDISTYFAKGEWPPGTTPEAFYQISMKLRAEGGFLRKPKEYDIRFYEISGEKIREIYNSVLQGGQFWKGWDEKLLTLLRADVFVLLIPAIYCMIPSGSIEEAQKLRLERSKFDFETLALLGAIYKFREFYSSKIRAISIIFTMHDMVAPYMPLTNYTEYIQAFQFLPQTYSQLQDIIARHSIQKNLQFFKSGIKVRMDEKDGKIYPAPDKIGFVPFYVREYLKLLKWLIQL
jgi:hypothetical protein